VQPNGRQAGESALFGTMKDDTVNQKTARSGPAEALARASSAFELLNSSVRKLYALDFTANLNRGSFKL